MVARSGRPIWIAYRQMACDSRKVTTLPAVVPRGLRCSQACIPIRLASPILRDLTEPPNWGPAYLGRLNNNCVTLAEVLKTAGYSTYGVGKWHVGDQVNPTDRGFDEYYGFIKGHSAPQWDPSYYHRYPETRTPELSFDDDAYYATEAFNDYAVEFIEQAQQKDKPLVPLLRSLSPPFSLTCPGRNPRFISRYLPPRLGCLAP